MANIHNLEVGQSLYFVASDRRGHSDYCEVYKVGRKWASICKYGNSRIDLETLRVDGGEYSSPGKCYLTKEEYEEKVKLDHMWSHFVSLVERNRNQAPKSATKDDIDTLIKCLEAIND